jgi:hypothetical protein
MKKLFILSTVVATSLIATTGYSQVYVNAHVGFRVPGIRVYATAPAPVYQTPPPAPVYDEYTPAPAYQDGYAPAPVYQDGCAPATVVYENEFPGYAYYNYPAWEGHYRDRFYYAHYRPFFERDYGGYFNRGRFDHERFEREHFNRGGFERQHFNGGYAGRGYEGHGRDGRGYESRGREGRGGGWDHRR